MKNEARYVLIELKIEVCVIVQSSQGTVFAGEGGKE
jgi:hypothetical protein